MGDPEIGLDPTPATPAEPAAAPSVASDAAATAAPPGGANVVNAQVVDTIATVEAADDAPHLTDASLAQIKAQAVGLALLNAVNAQQNAYVTANATVLAAVTRIMALGEPPPAGEQPEGAASD